MQIILILSEIVSSMMIQKEVIGSFWARGPDLQHELGVGTCRISLCHPKEGSEGAWGLKAPLLPNNANATLENVFRDINVSTV